MSNEDSVSNTCLHVCPTSTSPFLHGKIQRVLLLFRRQAPSTSPTPTLVTHHVTSHAPSFFFFFVHNILLYLCFCCCHARVISSSLPRRKKKKPLPRLESIMKWCVGSFVPPSRGAFSSLSTDVARRKKTVKNLGTSGSWGGRNGAA